MLCGPSDVRCVPLAQIQTVLAGRIVRIRDIGRVELGAQSYSKDFMQDNKPAAGGDHHDH